MNILITNDDGIEAEGLNILSDVLSENHNIYVIAPDSEKSACSNAITVRSKLTVTKVSDRRFTVNGFPADCVNIGLHGGIIPEIDLVISGINHGPNVGDDLFFSGTVAGARTAYIFNKSGIAVSLDSHNPDSLVLRSVSFFVSEFISEMESDLSYLDSMIADNAVNNHGASFEPLLFNINYPDLPKEQIKGTRLTYSGKRVYRDSYRREKSNDPDGIILMLDGNIESVHAEGSDTTELSKGFISITPLHLDCTDYSYLKMKASGKANVRG